MGKCFAIIRMLYSGSGFYYKGFDALQLGRQMPLLGLYEAWTTVLDMRDRGLFKMWELPDGEGAAQHG